MIQLVQRMRDGMDLAVLRFNAHQTPTTMEVNVCVQIQRTIVRHGNTMMEFAVFINLVHVLQEQHGMELIVLPISHVLQAFTV